MVTFIPHANAKKEGEPSEIEMMALEFVVACEKSKECKDKVKNGHGYLGVDEFEFKTYRTGKEMSKMSLKKKGKKDYDD